MSTVLVPLAAGFEELEAVTVIDLLRRAGIRVLVASLDGRPACGSHGIEITPDSDLDQAISQDPDMVVLPGGLPGADNLAASPKIIELLRSMAETGRFTAAICAAPKVLARAGLLQGRRATSYPGFLDNVGAPGLEQVDEAVVCDGTVITSRGPGTAMDFALALIEKLAGRQARDSVERGLVRSAAR
jgi:4-methyl-5(b-hydroxyethyl)-thiazole monophosphate biosynthesis